MRHMNERIEKLEEAQKDDATKSLETNLKEYIKKTIDNAVKEIKNPKSADDKTTSSNKESKSGDNDKT